MRNFLSATLAIGGILIAGGAMAQMNDMYTTGAGDNMMVMGGATGDKGVAIAKSKDQCKEGGYYMSGDKMVTACGEGGMSYDLMMPETGAMMNGKPVPEGTMMMKEHKM